MNVACKCIISCITTILNQQKKVSQLIVMKLENVALMLYSLFVKIARVYLCEKHVPYDAAATAVITIV